MPALPDPRPIETLNPTRRALVHDQLNDRIFEWKPEWASTWPDRRAHAPGVVEWDGLLLDGLEPVQGMTVPPLTDQVLHDILQKALDEALRDKGGRQSRPHRLQLPDAASEGAHGGNRPARAGRSRHLSWRALAAGL